MKRRKSFIPGRWLLSLFMLILIATVGAGKADAGGSYGGKSYDYYYELDVGESVTLNTISHANQTGFYWWGWSGYETNGRLEIKSGSYWWTHEINQRGKPLISRTHDIDGVAYFEMGSNSATVTATKPGIVAVNYTVTWWYTYYDTYLKMNVVAEQDAEQTTYAIIRVRGTPCTLTFNANGGEGSTYTQSATMGTSVTLSSNRFTRDGYTFTGWNTRADGTGTAYTNGASVTPNGNLTLYAQWKGAPCTLTFNANGGEGSTYTQSATMGTSVTLSSNRFTRDGYTFTGWNTRADGTGTAYTNGASVTPSGNLTLYAQWKGASCTLTFNANNGDESSYTQSATVGTSITLSSNRFTRDGYAFTGWNTKADGTGTSYADETNVTPNGDLTLFAQWKALPCVLTFDANGSEGSSYTQSATVGKSVKLLSNRFTRDKYIFTGWNTKADGTGEAYADRSNITPSGDLTLFAQWKAVCVLTFNANGGEGNSYTQSATANESVALSPNRFTRDSYIFTGWNTKADGTGTSYADEANVTPSGDLTLFAQWKRPNSGTCGDDLTWSLDSDGVLSISGEGRIDNNAFDGDERIHRIIIQDGITEIGHYAFSGCTGVTDISISGTVTSIGMNALSGCTGLTSIVIPDSITNIGGSAFSNCTGLTSVSIPNSVTSVSDYMFFRCTGLTSVTIPDSITNIGSFAFSGCTSLTSIVIPNSVTSIEDAAFSDCTGLTSVTIPDSVTTINDELFLGCTGLTSIILPNSVTSIECGAFAGCSGLTNISIPNSVTIIWDSAFTSCTGLTNISIPDSVEYIDMYVFAGCTGLSDIILPGSITNIGAFTFAGCTSLTSVVLPGSITDIEYSAFFDCTNLSSVTIPESVTSIDNTAFNGCKNLKDIYYGSTEENWKKIQGSEFMNFNIHYNDGSVRRVYSINEVVRSENNISVLVNCADTTASVFCGVYDNSGKMITVRSAQITSESNYQFQFDGQQFDYAKVFILDSNFCPLCEAQRM